MNDTKKQEMWKLQHARTIAGRRAIAAALAKRWNDWMILEDDALLREAQKEFPIGAKVATRDECLKFLTMIYVNAMIGD